MTFTMERRQERCNKRVFIIAVAATPGFGLPYRLSPSGRSGALQGKRLHTLPAEQTYPIPKRCPFPNGATLRQGS